MKLIIKLANSKKYRIQTVYRIDSLPSCIPSWLNNNFELDFDYVLDYIDVRTLIGKHLSKKIFNKVKRYINKQEKDLDKEYFSMFHEHLPFYSGFGYSVLYFIKDSETGKEYIQSGRFTWFDDRIVANANLFNDKIVNNLK